MRQEDGEKGPKFLFYLLKLEKELARNMHTICYSRQVQSSYTEKTLTVEKDTTALEQDILNGICLPCSRVKKLISLFTMKSFPPVNKKQLL